MVTHEYISVRRSSDAPFRVILDDLTSESPTGYDLGLMRDIALNGLDTPITVRPGLDGHFEVVDGRKRLAAIQMLVLIKRATFDRLRGLMRPADQVFALIRCRIRPRHATSISGQATGTG